jgi:hypothetical protein
VKEAAEKISEILKKYGDPPKSGEKNEIAFQKMLICIKQMDDKIELLEKRLTFTEESLLI